MQTALTGDATAFFESLQQEPPVSVRLHPFKGIGLFPETEKTPWHPQGRYLKERPSFTLDPLFHAGAYYVQEASSMFLQEVIAQTQAAKHGLIALDLCASPGGKTTLLLSAIPENSFLIANEVIFNRIPALRMNIEKWGYPNTAVSNHDPKDFAGLGGFFDLVLVDAPCSGEGLFRKDLNARSEWSEQNANTCSARQSRILEEAQGVVKSGGLLVYSTCTYNPAENEEQVKRMIERFDFEEIRLQIPAAWGIEEKDFGYQFYPHRVQGEGFYIAALRKKERQTKGTRFQNSKLNMERLTEKQAAPLLSWFEKPGEFAFFQKPNGEIVAFPKAFQSLVTHINIILRKWSPGFETGVLKNKELVPAHALALSLSAASSLPAIEVDYQTALFFLKKEPVPVPNTEKGWHLVKFNNRSLGWVKVLDNRVNNYLPNDWRIKMALPNFHTTGHFPRNDAKFATINTDCP
jgi:16S rRNA C967 or C1407 C5-methylase (RsmB/RsmF family)/NOL1/NOP2/fmu family ribosome biogenesis protein